MYYKKMNSFLGEITIVCGKNAILAVWIEGQSLGKKYDLHQFENKDIPILVQTEQWLKRYLNKENPNINELSFCLEGTPFQLEVWKLLCEIPYGTTTTYKKIAIEVAKRMHKYKMSAQAIGGAIGKNPISIIIPCHRVIGTNGKMVGYNGGISIKEKLIQFERSK